MKKKAAWTGIQVRATERAKQDQDRKQASLHKACVRSYTGDPDKTVIGNHEK